MFQHSVFILVLSSNTLLLELVLQSCLSIQYQSFCLVMSHGSHRSLRKNCHKNAASIYRPFYHADDLSYCSLARLLSNHVVDRLQIVVIPDIIQSKPYKMFAATLQPSWPSRPKTNVTLLFYFLKLYNFCFSEIFVGSTGSEIQHPWISKITTEPKKSQRKWFFRLNFEVINGYL